MAVKYFCDGCDAQIGEFTEYAGRQVKVLVEFVAKDTTELSGQFDLCAGCTRSLLRNADPRKWVRCAPEKAA